MNYHLTAPKRLAGLIDLPASKSLSNRALLLATLSDEIGLISRSAVCDDTRVMTEALTGEAHAAGGGVIDVGAAGTSMRFLTAYFAQRPGTWTLTGSERMKQRPIGLLVSALNRLGAEIEYLEKEGFPPLKISGKPLQGGVLQLDGGISSQFVSALLMLAPTMKQGLKLTLTGEVVSVPYIRMTLSMMEQFGAHFTWNGATIEVPSQSYRPTHYVVESDWSAASYWFALTALAEEADLRLKGLLRHSLQGDSRGAELFARLGVDLQFEVDGNARLVKTPCVHREIEYDFSSEPDLAQTFVVLCCLLGVRFRFTGLKTLKIKETDRMAALINECRKLGFVLYETENDTLEWRGETVEPADEIVISTYDDHRMAMSFAPAALKIEGVKIDAPGVVSKSYPDFWKHLEEVGFRLHTSP